MFVTVTVEPCPTGVYVGVEVNVGATSVITAVLSTTVLGATSCARWSP